MGRQSGIRIIAPAGGHRLDLRTSSLQGHGVATVRDVSQTDGPTARPRSAEGGVGVALHGIYDALTRVANDAGFTVVRETLPMNADVAADYVGRRIVIGDDLDDVAAVATLAHELAHVRMHTGRSSSRQRSNRSCVSAQEKIVLAGYSQGAHVVGDTFQDARNPRNPLGLKSGQSRLFAGAVMLGDPRFNYLQRGGVNVGDFLEPKNGIYDILHDPRTIGAKDTASVHSYCEAGDPVCNFTVEAAAICMLRSDLCPHRKYAEYGVADKAAVWLAGRV
jgi:hypothetical protein